MNLHLLEFYDRPDKALGGKIMVFQFEDEDKRIYRAEIPEGSFFYNKWYSLGLGLRTVTKQNDELWLSNVSIKPGTVEVEEYSDFKITTVEKDTAFMFPPRDEKITRKDWDV